MADPIQVLIVDDEPPVVDGLRTIITRDMVGFLVVGTAANGRDAIDRALTLQPDVVLLDVQMPGIDGIEALKSMRAQGVRSQVILITAYERFDVARRGYGLGVRDYLVKPVGPTAIQDALRKAETDIRDARERASEAVASAEASSAMLRLLEGALLHLLLAGASRTRVVRELLRYLKLESVTVLPLLVRFDGSQELQAPISERLHFAVHGPVGLIAPGQILALAFDPADSAGSLRDRVAASLKLSCGGATTVSVGNVSTLDQTRDCVLALSGDESAAPDVELFRLRSAVVRAVRIGDLQVADRYLESYLTHADALGVSEAAIEAMLVVLADEVGTYPGVTIDVAVSSILASRRETDQLASAALLRERVAEWTQTNASTGALSANVRAAIDIVRSEYQEDLSVEEIAERLRVSGPHLSRSFSAEVGQPLSAYLAEVRMERASSLLLEGALTIKEVATRCGFRDPNYFSRAFRAATGDSPTEFARRRREHERS